MAEVGHFGLTSADFVDAADGRVSEAMRTYEAACRAVAAWHAEPPTGIPDHKIGGTNDGWIVTPAEIRAALAALAAQPEEAKAGTFAEHPRWDEWVDHLTRAAAHGGFRVEWRDGPVCRPRCLSGRSSGCRGPGACVDPRRGGSHEVAVLVGEPVARRDEHRPGPVRPGSRVGAGTR